MGKGGRWDHDPGKKIHTWEVMFPVFCNLTGDSFPTQSPQATTCLFGFHPAMSFVLCVSRTPPTEDTCKPILLVS